MHRARRAEPEKKVATAAIQLAGTHAIAVKTAATPGSAGPSAQAMSPITVAIGAAGSASRFATTP